MTGFPPLNPATDALFLDVALHRAVDPNDVHTAFRALISDRCDLD